MTEETQKVPTDTLIVKTHRGNQELEVFMAAGMIRAIVTYLGDEERFIEMYTDPKVQNDLMTFVLAPKNEKGIMDPQFALDSLELSISEADKLLDWIQEHVMNFFIKRAETLLKQENGGGIQKLIALFSGSQTLQDEKQSAGLTTVDTVITK